MRRRMVALRILPPHGRHARGDHTPVEFPGKGPQYRRSAVDLAHAVHVYAPTVADNLSHVRDLPAGFRINGDSRSSIATRSPSVRRMAATSVRISTVS